MLLGGFVKDFLSKIRSDRKQQVKQKNGGNVIHLVGIVIVFFTFTCYNI